MRRAGGDDSVWQATVLVDNGAGAGGLWEDMFGAAICQDLDDALCAICTRLEIEASAGDGLCASLVTFGSVNEGLKNSHQPVASSWIGCRQ